MKSVASAFLLALSIGLPTAAQQDVFAPGNGVTVPVPVTVVKPSYTPAAMAAGIEGTVWLESVVQTDGTVANVTVVRSLDTVYGLDEQAVAALQQWRFKPGTKDGKPVPVRVTCELSFTLK